VINLLKWLGIGFLGLLIFIPLAMVHALPATLWALFGIPTLYGWFAKGDEDGSAT
jgi:hypothetical protein